MNYSPQFLFFFAFFFLPSFCFWGAVTVDVFLFYSSLFNCFFCTLPARGAVCFRPTAPLAHHRHAHDDGPVRLACCTHEEGPRRTAR
ncbi:hypothetical protein TCDM_09195 [Trypanosoma cruzi Dm28c]|uniref:Uncharacterized protein n=1 Tax=Trypanosoma cruzi Dm28c TaxID=1416333 RepID=V5D6L6_TRYCR|nr:hypothetical protein TCDM_09195 [Trypanosoma cruzi Dm28c]